MSLLIIKHWEVSPRCRKMSDSFIYFDLFNIGSTEEIYKYIYT